MINKIVKVLLPFLVVIGLFIVASAPVSAASQTLHVDSELVWVDYGTYVHGPINSPYLTINEALADMDPEGGTIKIAEGTYNENLDLHDLDNITIIGGYNGGPGESNPFTVQDREGQQSVLNGQITGTNISGAIYGMTFKNNIGGNFLISINLAGSGYDFELSDNFFSFNNLTQYFVKITANSGSTAEISGNHFANVTSSQALVDTGGTGDTTVRSNFFDTASSLNGSYGIIRATDGAKVYNNLIVNSGPNNRVAIRISEQAEVYNNTIAGGSALTAAIATSGTEEHNVYNNLVANMTGPDFVWAASADQEGNSSDCDPDFVGGSGFDAYKLGENSTCIDLGTTVSLASPDFFGTTRPSGAAYDVGFHELIIVEACGNGILEGVEECDDGNLLDGDDCSAICEIEFSLPVVGICGDGTVDSGEQCDDGNNINGDGCSAMCEDEVVVACGGWLDINSSDSHYAIAVYLCDHGEIVKGDAFGNLRIDDDLTRAELLAMAFRAREYKGYGVVDQNAEACFNDVTDDWYAKYFCTAKVEGFVEGYVGNVAKPGAIVLLGEGLKMFLGALDKVYTIDTDDCWYCSMVTSAGNLNWIPFQFTDPTEVGPMELSRRYAMDMLYRMLTN